MRCDGEKLGNGLEYGIGRELGIEDAVPRVVERLLRCGG
jgi:hypothetical protein